MACVYASVKLHRIPERVITGNIVSKQWAVKAGRRAIDRGGDLSAISAHCGLNPYAIEPRLYGAHLISCNVPETLRETCYTEQTFH